MEVFPFFLVGDERGRIGASPEGFQRIQTHAWFESIRWGALLRQPRGSPEAGCGAP